MRRLIHRFESTINAYGMCQIGEYIEWDNNKDAVITHTVRSGDILLIESENVIGIVDMWPMAITSIHGELHKCAAGYKLDDPNGRNGSLLERIIDEHNRHGDVQLSYEHIRGNVKLAKEMCTQRGWSIADYA